MVSQKVSNVAGHGVLQLMTTICGSQYILAFSGTQVTTQTLSGLPMVWREFLLLREIPMQLMWTGKMLSRELIEVFPLPAMSLWLDGTSFQAMFSLFFPCCMVLRPLGLLLSFVFLHLRYLYYVCLFSFFLSKFSSVLVLFIYIAVLIQEFQER